MATDRDTIAAVATAPGAGGVGIVRVSGPAARAIGAAVCGRALRPRHAHFARFRDADGEVIDEGVALLFAGPASYTGEDVLELQGHGGAIVLQALLRRCLALGARPARAGEFTERAFLEGKLDLAQAEAVADLVAAGSLAAVRAARRSLEGEFSRQVEDLLGQLLDLRMYIEAALDFPDEQIDFLAAPELQRRRDRAQCTLEALLAGARRQARPRACIARGRAVVAVPAPRGNRSARRENPAPPRCTCAGRAVARAGPRPVARIRLPASAAPRARRPGCRPRPGRPRPRPAPGRACPPGTRAR